MAMQMRRHDIPRDLNEFVLNDVNITGTTLGRGAFSVVEELKIGGTLCAGKRPHPELLRTFNESEPGIFKQFREECKLMSKMHHPRIVQFLGLFYFDDSPYPMLVMEKLDVNLDTVLEIYANIPFPLILHVLKDITEGLIYLHNQKPPVMHRDLTARSILIYQSSFTAKISGLGNARLCDRTLQFEPDECLTQVPGSLLYMAPEALELKPTYDCRLDMFSFGHLALFAIIQEFPQHLKPSIFYDDKGHLKGRTEVERREKYIMKLIAKLTEGHRVTKMILQCLHISPQKRPTAYQAMEQIASVSTVEDDAHGLVVNLIELIHKVESKAAYYGAAGTNQSRIENFKNGTPGLLEIFRVGGSKISRKKAWRNHVFQIKDGNLNYYKQEKMDRPYDSLSLSSIVAVKRCPLEENWNKSMFYFEVHVSDSTSWLLRAYTQDDQICWMKAISSSPGLLAYTANESPGPYQTVTPDTEVEMSSHSGTSRHEHLGIQEGTILEHHYDYPNTPVESQAQITSESQAVAMNQKSSADVTSTASQDKDSYSDIKLLDATTGRETADDHEYEDMSRSIPATQVKGPRDKELSVLAGHLLNMNPSEAILWLLDQIHQVVVEKFVGVHESKVVESSIQEIEEIYDEVQITASTLPVPPRATSTERVQTSYPRDTLSSVHELISCQSNVAYYSGNKASPSKSIPKAEKLPHYHLPAVRPPPVRQKLDSCVPIKQVRQHSTHTKMTGGVLSDYYDAAIGSTTNFSTGEMKKSDDCDGINTDHEARSDWIKPDTHFPQLEPALTDLEQKSLFQDQPTAIDTPTSHLQHPSHPKARRARSKSPLTTERHATDSHKATNQPTARDTPTSHLEHPSHPKARRARSKSPLTTERHATDSHKATKPPASCVYSDDKEQYDVVDATASTDPIEEYDLECDMEEENPPLQARSRRRSVTFPKELSALAEISIKDLSNLNPDEAQLWMLNQMQKLVQKFAGIYESTAVGPLPKSNRRKVLPLQNIEEVYDNVQLESPHQKESPTSSRKISRQTKTAYIASTSSTSSKLLAGERSPQHQSAAAYPQIKPKPVSLVGMGSAVTVQQKREATHAEMISTLKARHKNLSSEISSHLVTDGNSSRSAATIARPDWTKETRSSQLEVSLADLKQKAVPLFLPRSALSEKLEEIGQGQFGKIFKGVYKRSEGEGLPVVIKTVKKYESEKERQSFQKEMAVMSKLIHPNIVRFFGLVKQDQLWIVLEFLHHGDLKTFLTKKKQPVNKLIKYMLDVATGMHYISEKGLIHRDLAARNVMVSQDEICKVGDFREIPKDADIYMSKAETKFPIRWMAPESIMKREFSPASDVWSFGVVMWEMYSPTELPYKGMSNMEVAANIKGTRLEVPSSYPSTVADIMKACWQLEPSERPSFLLIAMLLTNVVLCTDQQD